MFYAIFFFFHILVLPFIFVVSWGTTMVFMAPDKHCENESENECKDHQVILNYSFKCIFYLKVQLWQTKTTVLKMVNFLYFLLISCLKVKNALSGK